MAARADWEENNKRREAGLRPLSPERHLRAAAGKVLFCEYFQIHTEMSARHLAHNKRKKPIKKARGKLGRHTFPL